MHETVDRWKRLRARACAVFRADHDDQHDDPGPVLAMLHVDHDQHDDDHDALFEVVRLEVCDRVLHGFESVPGVVPVPSSK